jgi:hypothetical protein
MVCRLARSLLRTELADENVIDDALLNIYMQHPSTLRFGETIIYVRTSGTLIHFADGRSVAGEPEDSAEYRATAERCGYGSDTLSLCIDHEIVHVALADWLGFDSPTMLAVRDEQPDQACALRVLEEAAVLAIQQYAKAAGIDLRLIGQ